MKRVRGGSDRLWAVAYPRILREPFMLAIAALHRGKKYRSALKFGHIHFDPRRNLTPAFRTSDHDQAHRRISLYERLSSQLEMVCDHCLTGGRPLSGNSS